MGGSRGTLAWLAAAVLTAAVGAALSAFALRPPTLPPVTVSYHMQSYSAGSVAELKARIDAIKAGRDGAWVTEVPRLALAKLPADWNAIGDTRERKAAFVSAVLPLVLAANERIEADRRRLDRLHRQGGPRTARDRQWLAALADRYGARDTDIAALKQRVDIIPASLAVAQAAVESGWGQSRFAHAANALYGQWTWKPDQGVRPRNPDASRGDYAIRRFRALYGSVAHYMLNLNRHPAYAPFRRLRSQARKAGRTPDGAALAGGLSAYSVIGPAYIATLRQVMRENRLQRLDKARLAPADGFGGASTP